MEPGDWPQAVIEFAGRRAAEQVAARHLRPALAAAQADGVISGWWFIRKAPWSTTSGSIPRPDSWCSASAWA
jgi:protein-L-isoaspartate(D-aspartate) O-methyltransferase